MEKELTDRPPTILEPYVALAGPIAAGKTTLAGRLAERWGYLLVREPFERNPFLAEFYHRGKDVALANELYFLWSRFEQLRTVPPLGEAARGPVVTDYTFAKGLLFASITLSPVEQTLYRQLYDLLAGRVRQPDLIVYLTDTTDRLLERVRLRGRPMEHDLTAEYIEPLRAAYERAFLAQPGRLICIDCSQDDPLAEPTIRRIEDALQQLQ